MVVMDHIFNITATERAIINLRFTPLANATNQVSRFRGQGNIFGFWITVYESMANSQAPASSAGLDSAPGGTFDMTSLADLAGSNALLTEFFENLLIDYFSFVPTLSSLAITGSNWYEPVTGASVTPFVATSVPTENEGHVTLTATNLAFTLNEILNPPLAAAEHTFSGLQVQNPIGNSVNMYTTTPIVNANVSIAELTGKVIFTIDGQNIEGDYQIPVALSNGMYFLSVKNNEGSITKKLVKN